jgi:methionyl-tRNA synthetase
MNYYLTTPIYYTNGTPHIGHTYSTIVADVLRRFKKMHGHNAVVTTGTDEHGVNVERAAQALGKAPKEFVDLVVPEWRSHWDDLRIQGDHFIRTSSPEHHRTVQWFFERCRANGFVYKGTYTGQYCVFDNLYVNEAKPGDPCPECGRPTETVTEENFFFKLSAFQDRLLEHYSKHPDFIQPESRRNEVIRFVEGGLADLSITRTTINWGIPVPGEAPHVFYVWFDALLAYLTGAGGPDWEKQGLWPADLHLIGKEILRFHAVFWPAFLMGAGLPLPKKIFAHGWLLFEQDKMSKSRGNIVRPKPIAEVVGMDPLRLFLLREIVFGQDGSFSYDALVQRYNSDLANGIGNLASRTFAMINQYSGGAIPAASSDQHIAATANGAVEQMLDCFERLDFTRGMDAIWSLVSAVDKFIVERAPWKLAKDPDSKKLLDETLYTAAEAVRVLCVMLYPVLPDSMPKIWSQLGMASSLDQARVADLHWGKLESGQKLGAISGVFPRLDSKPVVKQLQEREVAERARQNAILGKKDEPASEAAAPAAGVVGMREGISPLASEITIDDFVKVDLRVGQVMTAEKVKGSDKLLHLTVDIGEAQGPRTIVAGIALAYEPEKMIGRKVVIVANLAPRKLKGITSQGMIVAASLEGGSPVLAAFLEDVPVGARLK